MQEIYSKFREQNKINLVYFLCRDGVTYQKVVQMSGKTKLFGFFSNAAYLHGAKRRKISAKYR